MYDIAEAKMHLSKSIERGERITIARNSRPVTIVSYLAVALETGAR